MNALRETILYLIKPLYTYLPTTKEDKLIGTAIEKLTIILNVIMDQVKDTNDHASVECTIVVAFTVFIASLGIGIYVGIGMYNYYKSKVVSTFNGTNYFTTHYKTIKDSIFFELDASLLLASSSSPPLITPWRSIETLRGTSWRLQVHPNTAYFKSCNDIVESKFFEVHMEIDTNVKNIKTDAVIVYVKAQNPFEFEMPNGHIRQSHDEIKVNGAIHNGKLVFRVDVVFTTETQVANVSPSLPEAPGRLTLIDFGDTHDSCDAILQVENKNIDLHRGFLSIISPVFHAMFKPDTAESKSGIVNIKDFDYNTVHTAIKFIYGQCSDRLSADEVIGIYRFADKYRIEAVITKMEAWLSHNVDVTNFCAVVSSTWSFASPALRAVCGRIFHNNLAQLALREEFLRLPESDIVEILEEAAKYR